MRFISPLTPTNDVSTAPLSTATASTAISWPSQGPPATVPRYESRVSACGPTVASGSTAMATKANNGLNTVTTTHILRSVFWNTPGACSSTKLAELSNPEMPSMAALNPKNNAPARLPSRNGARKLSAKWGKPWVSIYPPATPTSTVSEARCTTKMTTATFADSEMPRMVSSKNSPSSPSVAPMMGSAAHRLCR